MFRIRSLFCMVAVLVLIQFAYPAFGQFVSVRPPGLLNLAPPATSPDSETGPALATDGAGTWIAVWAARTLEVDPEFSTGEDFDLFYSRSMNDGVTWTRPFPLNANAISDVGDDTDPHIATDGHGNWTVVWSSTERMAFVSGSTPLDTGPDRDIFIARSTMNGETWGPTWAAEPFADFDTGDDFAPRIAMDANANAFVVWRREGVEEPDQILSGLLSGPDAPRLNGDGISLRSSDNFLGDPDIATDGNGRWIAVWEEAGDILFSRKVLASGPTEWEPPRFIESNDFVRARNPRIKSNSIGVPSIDRWVVAYAVTGTALLPPSRVWESTTVKVSVADETGANWSTPIQVGQHITCQCEPDPERRPPIDIEIGFSATDVWLVAWDMFDRSDASTNEDRDIFFARSVDNGRTWAPQTPLNSTAAEDTIAAGNDQSLGLAASRAGTFVAMWATNNTTINGANSNDRVPDIAFARSIDDGHSYSDPFVLRTAVDTFQRVNSQDDQVDMATDGRGTWVAVWSTDKFASATDDTDILFARSTDNGATWTPERLLNTNGSDPSENGADHSPRIATDGNGLWIVVWVSDQNRLEISPKNFRSIGNDSDILYSTSFFDGQVWSNPRPLNGDAETDDGLDEDPVIAANGDGDWMVVWVSDVSDLTDAVSGVATVHAFSDNNGIDWSPNREPLPFGSGEIVTDQTPSLAVNGDKWVVAWSRVEQFRRGEFAQSIVVSEKPAEFPWTEPFRLTPFVSADEEFAWAPSIATDRERTWVVTWVRSVRSDSPVFNNRESDIKAAFAFGGGRESDSARLRWDETSNGIGFVNDDAEFGAIWEDENPAITAVDRREFVVAWERSEIIDDLVIFGLTPKHVLGARLTFGTLDESEQTIHNATEIQTTGQRVLHEQTAPSSVTGPPGPRVVGKGGREFLLAMASGNSIEDTINSDTDILFTRGEVKDNIVSTGAARGGGGGCFIATAAYGTPLDDRIDVLRTFRDEHLLTNPFGSAFVDAYYRASPPLAERVSASPAFRTLVRTALVPVIASVQSFESSWSAGLWAILALAAGSFVVAARRSLLKKHS